MKKICFLMLLLTAISQTSYASERCFHDTYCITTQELQDGIQYSFRNLQSAPITFNFNVKGENIKLSAPSRTIRVVDGFEESLLASVIRDKPTKAWEAEYHFDWQIGDFDAEHNINAVYRLPFSNGETYRVSQGYNGGFSHGGKHAIDFAMPIGTPILAARAGIVIASSAQNVEKYRNPRLSNYVYILHEDRTIAKYHHLRYEGIKVMIGEKVEQGEFIALSGNTGRSTGPHLHFEVCSPSDGTNLKTYPVWFASANEGIVVPQKNAWLTALPVEQGTTFAKNVIDSSGNL